MKKSKEFIKKSDEPVSHSAEVENIQKTEEPALSSVEAEQHPLKVQALKHVVIGRNNVSVALTPGKIFTGRLAKYLLDVKAPVVEI